MSDEGFDWAAEAAHLVANAQNDAEFYDIMDTRSRVDTDDIVIDFGCGGAGMAVAMRRRSRKINPSLRVVGLDAHHEVYAEAAADHPDISFAVASFEDSSDEIRRRAGGAADLIWARGSLHHADDEQSALRTLADVLKSGGTLAVAEGGTTVAHLPDHLGIGEPGIHHRLAAAMHQNYRRLMADATPMPYGWPIGLRNAGLIRIHTRNVLFDKPAPLEGADMDHVLRKYAKQVEWAEDFLEPDDLSAWRQLLNPEDPAWLGARDDLFWLAALSVHMGVKPTELPPLRMRTAPTNRSPVSAEPGAFGHYNHAYAAGSRPSPPRRPAYEADPPTGKPQRHRRHGDVSTHRRGR